MIPVKLKIEGFLSYRQPVELDFNSFHIACISGPNGAGKSSLLDAITWALFGQARKRDESIINNHPSEKAAQVSLDFDYEGNRYRVYRSNPRGKTSMVEFYIWSQKEDGTDGRWKPLTERSVRETSKKIQETLKMDFDTFTNASFFLQGKADQFATARPADRKKILSNILGLEVWETYRERASQKRRMIEKDVKTLDGRLAEIQIELDEGPQRKKQLKMLQEQLDVITKQRIERAAILENVRRVRAALDEQVKTLDTYKNQIESLNRNRDQTLRTLAERRNEKDTYVHVVESADAIEAAYQQWQAARVALEAMDGVAAQFRERDALRQEPLRQIESERVRLEEIKQHLMDQKTSLENSLAAEPGLAASREAALNKITQAEKKLAQREALHAEMQRLQAAQADAKAGNPRLRMETDELRARRDQLAAAEGVECPVCGQPLAADERQVLIDQLTTKGNQLRDRFFENKSLLENFEKDLHNIGSQLADLNDVDAALREATRQVDQIDHKLNTLEQQRSEWEKTGEPRLAEVITILKDEAFSPDARDKLRLVDKELAALGYDLALHEKLRRAEAIGRQAEDDLRKLETARAALAPIEREIKRLDDQLAELENNLAVMAKALDELTAKVAAAEVDLPDLDQAESDMHDAQEQENKVRQDVGMATQRVVVLESSKERKTEFLEKREELNQQIANLLQLERAFGKDGIPALLIEQALPEIEEATNTLLSRLSNGNMSFSFVTQREYKDSKREDLKETLDMVVSDSVGERDYELFSGGEAFRVNFSIRLALSQLLARRSGARLQTLVIDEGFGSQDEQGRQRLIEAINLVKGDFEKILVITHLDELKEAFPNRIEVEKTAEGSMLQVV